MYGCYISLTIEECNIYTCFICLNVVTVVFIKAIIPQYSRVPVLLDVSLTVKAATLIFISGRGSAISSAKEGKSGFIYNLVKS